MKLRFIVLVLAMLILSQPVYSHDNKDIEEKRDKFRIETDGSVRAGAFRFNSIADYVRSDYFKRNGKRCGTREMYFSRTRQLYRSTEDCTTSKTTIRNEYWPDQVLSLPVPVVFHVITKTDGSGNVTDQQIHDQIQVLNEDFGAIVGTMGANGFDTKIRFMLAGITRSSNDSWFNDENQSAYKQALAWNTTKYLNVYTNSASGNLGYAYYPQDMAGQMLDGIVLLYTTVGGRNNGAHDGLYDQGRTLVHEVGHYFGLLHTFEGGCGDGYEAGDLIADTNTEEIDHYSCVQTNTCGTPDPIHNYMNYTDDDCMTHFTAEQANRMICSLVNYRPELSATYYAPINGNLQQMTSNLIFREEKFNILTWDVNPLNNGKIVKYLITRKGEKASSYSDLTELNVLTYTDRHIGDNKYSYLIYGIDEAGIQSIPVKLEN